MNKKIRKFLKKSEELERLGEIIHQDKRTFENYSNQLSDIIVEYISRYIKLGGYTVIKNIKDKKVKNALFLKELMTKLLDKNDDDIFLIIKKSQKEHLNELSEISKQELLKLSLDNSYIGNKNDNIETNICVRVMPIGIHFHNDIDKMIEYTVKMAKLTHYNTIGILSAISSVYFTSLAYNEVDISKWFELMLELMKSEKVKKYLDLDDNTNMIDYVKFLTICEKYYDTRFVDNKISISPVYHNLTYRINFYLNLRLKTKGIMGIGNDCINCLIVGYDVLLCCDTNLEKIIYYGMLFRGEINTLGAYIGGLYGLISHKDNSIH